MRYVIYSETDGIYLGSSLGLGFWTKLDPAGQEEACTFDSAEDAQAFIAEHPKGWEPDCRPVGVQTTEEFASMAVCVAAGLPAWDPH